LQGIVTDETSRSMTGSLLLCLLPAETALLEESDCSIQTA